MITMDTGYSWLILTGAYLNYFIIVGNFKTAGIFYAEMLEKYDIGSGSTSFYYSILRLFNAIIGPLAGFLSMTYSFRAVAFTGGCLVGLGLSVSAFVSKPEILFFTYSTVVGIGSGLALTPSISIVNYYFEKRRALANGIVASAGGLCTVVLSPLFRYAFDMFGLHGGMLLLGGVFLNMCVGSAFYRQPHILLNFQEFETKHTSVMSVTFRFLHTLCHTFKSILKCRGFILYTVAFGLALLGYAGNFIIIPSHLRSRGVPKDVIILVLMTTGGVEVVSRILIGRIVDQHCMKPDFLFAVNIGISGVMCLVFPLFDSVPMYFVYSVILGSFPGSMFAYLPEIVIPICGLKLLPPAVSLYTLSMNLFVLTGAPLTGWLEDLTGNWNASFYVLGSVQIVSSLAVFLWRICNKQRKKTKTEANIDGVSNEVENIPMIETVNYLEEKS